MSAELNLTDPSKDLFKSSVDVKSLDAMEQMIKGSSPPNAKDGFSGLKSPKWPGDILPPAVPKPELRPVMSLHSAVADVKRVSRGESVGYGRTFIAEHDTTIALVPIGYHDGYRRVLSNRSKVIIREQPAPVVGRISMDWTIVDVTDIPGTSIGDEVTLIGSMGKLCITAEDLARSAGTISYEITCGIGPRVPHVYINGVE